MAISHRYVAVAGLFITGLLVADIVAIKPASVLSFLLDTGLRCQWGRVAGTSVQ